MLIDYIDYNSQHNNSLPTGIPPTCWGEIARTHTQKTLLPLDSQDADSHRYVGVMRAPTLRGLQP